MECVCCDRLHASSLDSPGAVMNAQHSTAVTDEGTAMARVQRKKNLQFNHNS